MVREPLPSELHERLVEDDVCVEPTDMSLQVALSQRLAALKEKLEECRNTGSLDAAITQLSAFSIALTHFPNAPFISVLSLIVANLILITKAMDRGISTDLDHHMELVGAIKETRTLMIELSRPRMSVTSAVA